MARRIANTKLTASSIDIINVIRENSNTEYQNAIPKIEKITDIPKVGTVLFDNPTFANNFLSSLVNRIGYTIITSKLFNNPYEKLKKGVLDFGESIEEIFMGLAKAHVYNPEKSTENEYKRFHPDVKNAFHVVNWRVFYPVTVEKNTLYQAFQTENGVTNFIMRIVETVYRGANYDEFLLFKYMLIKSISKGQLIPHHVGNTTKEKAEAFRAVSNGFTFMGSKYNTQNVKNICPKEKQCIFMDANYNAKFDVDFLANAFNLDKALYTSNLFLIDDWAEFDNERFEFIRKESDGLEEITEEELKVMKTVKAVLLDEDFFQVYDNLTTMTEKESASGLYTNYFYHVWKIVSFSPFANAVVFTEKDVVNPDTVKIYLSGKEKNSLGTVLTFNNVETTTVNNVVLNYTHNDTTKTAEIAVTTNGAVIVPEKSEDVEFDITAKIGNTVYKSNTKVTATGLNVNENVTLNKQ